LKITLTDERTEKTAEFKFTGGITEFVKHLNRGKSTLHDSPIYIEGKRGNVEIEIALQYNDTYGETFLRLRTLSIRWTVARIFRFSIRVDAIDQQLCFRGRQC